MLHPRPASASTNVTPAHAYLRIFTARIALDPHKTHRFAGVYAENSARSSESFAIDWTVSAACGMDLRGADFDSASKSSRQQGCSRDRSAGERTSGSEDAGADRAGSTGD